MRAIVAIMSWLLVAILSPLIYTLTNFVDKYLLANKVRDYNSLPIYTASVSFLFGVLWWIVVGFPNLGWQESGLLILTGIITMFSAVLYFQALSIQETSIVIFLFQLTPVMSWVLAYLLLGESISGRQLSGFLIILVSTLVMVWPDDKWQLPTGFWLIMAVNFLYAISGIMMKFVSETNSFSQVVGYESLGIGIGGILIFIGIPKIRRAFLTTRKEMVKNALPVVVVNEVLFILAKSLGYFAFMIGPVALVSVVANIQVFFGIILGYSLTRLFPKLFNERVDKKFLRQKIYSAAILFVGLYLLT